MKTILLVQNSMLPVPPTISVLNNWGRETVLLGEREDFAAGDVMLLDGEPQAFVEWLSPFDAVWTSTSPMMGRWSAMHIKQTT